MLCSASIFLNKRRGRREFSTNIAELGGIPLLLQAIRHCVDNADLLRTGCALIHHLSTSGSSRNNLFNHNVIDVLLIVMNNYQNSTEILKMCIVSLRQISTDNDLPGQGRYLFIPLLIRLMNLHPNDDGVQFYSLILMGTVGRKEPIHHRLTVPTIVSAMRRFPDHGKIGFFGSLLFWKILSNDSTNNSEALLFISSSGGIECVIAATIANNDNIDGLSTVAHAILTHAWENRPSEQETAVLAFGGNRRIISLITKYNVRNDINANNDDDDDEGVIYVSV